MVSSPPLGQVGNNIKLRKSKKSFKAQVWLLWESQFAIYRYKQRTCIAPAMYLISGKTTGLPNNLKPPIGLKLHYITIANGQMIQPVIRYRNFLKPYHFTFAFILVSRYSASCIQKHQCRCECSEGNHL